MKKIIFSILALCLVVSMQARTVSLNDAGKSAALFFKDGATKASSSGLKLVWTGPMTTKSSFAPFYVFNRDGGGWVIIAGDDRSRPILGFSYTGKFVTEGMPANISSWFTDIADAMTKVNSSNERQAAKVAQEWAALATSDDPGYKVIKQLETAQWDQGDDNGTTYNKYCPTKNGVHCITGCVQTSTAIVMRYHKWPAYGTGEIPSYSSTTTDATTLGPVTLGHAYNWDAMPLEVNSSTDFTEIATLMFELGVMNQAIYNTNANYGTSANLNCQALVKYFNYDPSISHYNKDGFTDDQWCDMLRSNIDNVGPIPYVGRSTSGGHQFLIDGYAENDYFCINWGWSGVCNGTYSINCLGDSSFDYSQYQEAYFNMKPYKDGKSNNTGDLVFTRYASNNGPGLVQRSGSFTKGGKIIFDAYYIYNNSSTTSWNLLFTLCDHKGNIVSDNYIYASGISIATDYVCTDVGYHIELSISKDVKLGDKIRAFYSFPSDEYSFYRINSWLGEPVPDEIAAFDYPVIDINSDGYKAGDLFYYKITNTNRVYNVRWFFDSVERTMADIFVKSNGTETLTAGEHTIRAILTFGDGTTRTLVRKINVSE